MPLSDTILTSEGQWPKKDQTTVARIFLDTLTQHLQEHFGPGQTIEYLVPYNVDRAIESGEILNSDGTVNTDLIPDRATKEGREEYLTNALSAMLLTCVDGVASIAQVLYPDEDISSVLSDALEKVQEELTLSKVDDGQARALRKIKQSDYLLE